MGYVPPKPTPCEVTEKLGEDDFHRLYAQWTAWLSQCEDRSRGHLAADAMLLLIAMSLVAAGLMVVASKVTGG